MADNVADYLLAALDAALYAVLVIQLLRSRARSRAGPGSMADAFSLLGTEVGRAIPAISPGFTWHEAVAESKKLDLDVDWLKVERALDAYEGFRYGGGDDPGSGYEEIGRFALELRRRK